MKLYALLIGINDYPVRALAQCVKDAEKVENYLRNLSNSFSEVNIKKLLDENATKENIILAIREFISLATDTDVALIYYSGHGAQEETAGRFPEEHDGLMECLVCYDAESLDTAQLLADKEIRYLLSQLPYQPHLVTLFDCCHSGDIVRAFYEEGENDDYMIRRISGGFPAREYDDFLFAHDPDVETILADGSKKVNIHFKNHIHIAACQSGESSWEDSKGGVFTRYLLTLLERTQGNLTYHDIARWSKISLKQITEKQQTPQISVQGGGRMSADQSWLNMHPEGVDFPKGFATYHSKKGWIYTKGALLGIEPGMNVIIHAERDVTARVKEVNIEESTIAVKEIDSEILDRKTNYPADTEISTYTVLKVFVNEIDEEHDLKQTIETWLQQQSGVTLTNEEEADFYINLFNKFVYFTLPQHDFQPLAEQIDIKSPNLLSLIEFQLNAFCKWQHFYSLENPANNFNKTPLRVTVKNEDGTVTDITHGTYTLQPMEERNAYGEQEQQLKVYVSNISKETLYVGVLALTSDMAITSNPFDNMSVELPPGETKQFYDHTDGYASIFIDEYKEVYNWKEEWFYYKFIYNNFEDFTGSLNSDDFLQPALPPPLTVTTDESDRGGSRGEGSRLKEVKKKWGTCRTKIELANTSYNIITGALEKNLEAYAGDVRLAPFIKELYFEEYHTGKGIALRLKQNKNATAEVANRDTDNLLVKFMNYLYKTSRKRKFLQQRNTAGPVVIAEGDSWFLFPKPGVRDTLDYIMEKFHLLSLAEAGDEIADYLKNNELIEAVKRYKPKYVLISGGGNDILGAEIRQILRKNVRNGADGIDYIDEMKFRDKIKFLSDGYRHFIEEIHRLQPDARIFVHGYDYIRSNPDPKTIKKGWANRYMIEAEIREHETRKKIIYFLVDSFNDMLKALADQFSHVRYVNNRMTVGMDEWMDEIHPNNVGYQKVANNFLKMMVD